MSTVDDAHDPNDSLLVLLLEREEARRIAVVWPTLAPRTRALRRVPGLGLNLHPRLLEAWTLAADVTESDADRIGASLIATGVLKPDGSLSKDARGFLAAHGLRALRRKQSLRLLKGGAAQTS